LLNFYRNLLHWRQAQTVLLQGEQSLLPLHVQVMWFVRSHEGQRVLCAFNFSDHAAQLTLPQGMQASSVLDLPGLQGGLLQGQSLQFKAFGGLLLSLV
jgi:alpha-glucosidase